MEALFGSAPLPSAASAVTTTPNGARAPMMQAPPAPRFEAHSPLPLPEETTQDLDPAVGPYHPVLVVKAKDRAEDVYELATGQTLIGRAPENDIILLEESVSRPRFTAALLGLFAGVAILLAMIGVYGVLSYAVAQRGPEVGIRLALGASRWDVFREVVGEGLWVTAVGAALGAAAALATSRLLQGLVFGVSATDATTYVVVIGVVLSAAILASLLPAARASRTDPVALLKAE